MNRVLRRLAAFLLTAAVLPGAATASETGASPPEMTHANAAALLSSAPKTLGYELLPERFRHRSVHASRSVPARAVTARAATARARYTASLAGVDYRDRAALITRLKELDDLKLLTFWETRAFAVFFGVSREGLAGLNVSQKSDRSGDENEDEEPAADPVPEPTFLAVSAYRR